MLDYSFRCHLVAIDPGFTLQLVSNNPRARAVQHSHKSVFERKDKSKSLFDIDRSFQHVDSCTDKDADR